MILHKESQLVKIAYLTTYDVANITNIPVNKTGLFSAGSYLANSLLMEDISIDYLGPINIQKSILTKSKWEYYRRVQKKDYYSWAEPLILKDYAKKISNKLSKTEAHVILCPENAVPIAYLECQQPLVLWTDAPLGALIDFYSWLNNLCSETRKNILSLEKLALDRCDLIIFTSQWAARKAIDIYDLPVNKVKVIPWGANIECQRTPQDINKFVQDKKSNKCKLLFIGVDWLRKGGDIAFEVAQTLNQLGLETELIIVGCKPSIQAPIPDFVKVIGYLDKSNPESADKLYQLFIESHFLILPTLADCSPHVLIEASSFGVPSLAADIAGIPDLIRDNITGKTFPIPSNPSSYCDYIIKLMSNYEEYQRQALAAFQDYQTRLNWSVIGKRAIQLLEETFYGNNSK